MQGKKQTLPVKSFRKRASTPAYVSPNQLIFAGFETPFEQQLTKNNRWIKLSIIRVCSKTKNACKINTFE
ncbi:MAG: hypothetical protein ACK50L_02250, partial [Bacteroidota bacterium]